MADKKSDEPWLTVRFYPDGTSQTETGPGEYPTEPDAVVKTNGAVLMVLWQVAEAGYRRMLAVRALDQKLQNYLSKLMNDSVSDGTPN